MTTFSEPVIRYVPWLLVFSDLIVLGILFLMHFTGQDVLFNPSLGSFEPAVFLGQKRLGSFKFLISHNVFASTFPYPMLDKCIRMLCG